MVLSIALIAVAALFGGLFLLRLAGLERRFLWRRAGAIALGALAVLSFARGQLLLGLMLFAAALAVWLVGPVLRAERPAARSAPSGAGPNSEDPIAAARRLLNVRVGATPDEIRAAHRLRMREAHPDRGGSVAMAARLNAARDLLLQGVRPGERAGG